MINQRNASSTNTESHQFWNTNFRAMRFDDSKSNHNHNIFKCYRDHRQGKRTSFTDEESVYSDQDYLYEDQVSVISDPIVQLSAMTNICLDGVDRPPVSRLSTLTEHDTNVLPTSSEETLSSTSHSSRHTLQQQPHSCVLLSASANSNRANQRCEVHFSPRLMVRQSSSLRSICETNENEEVSLKPPERTRRAVSFHMTNPTLEGPTILRSSSS